MSYEYSKLAGAIKEHCGTQAIFASKMGVSERTISLKMNGIRDWRQNEIKKACQILGIEEKDIPIYFFSIIAQN